MMIFANSEPVTAGYKQPIFSLEFNIYSTNAEISAIDIQVDVLEPMIVAVQVLSW